MLRRNLIVVIASLLYLHTENLTNRSHYDNVAGIPCSIPSKRQDRTICLSSVFGSVTLISASVINFSDKTLSWQPFCDDKHSSVCFGSHNYNGTSELCPFKQIHPFLDIYFFVKYFCHPDLSGDCRDLRVLQCNVLLLLYVHSVASVEKNLIK